MILFSREWCIYVASVILRQHNNVNFMRREKSASYLRCNQCEVLSTQFFIEVRFDFKFLKRIIFVIPF